MGAMLRIVNNKNAMMALAVLVGMVSIFFAVSKPVSSPKMRDIDKIEIVDLQLDKVRLFIPRPYFHELAGPGPDGSQTLLLTTLYPEFVPLRGTIKDLEKIGRRQDHITILGSTKLLSGQSFDTLSHKMFDGQIIEQSDLPVEEPAGLTYRGVTGDKLYDVWSEKDNSRIQSFVRCGKQILEHQNMHCRHFFYMDQVLLITATYNRTNLVHWKSIQKNITSLFDSFKSLQTSRSFLEQRFKKEFKQHSGTQGK